MRAIEYLVNFKKHFPKYEELYRVIRELMPLRLDREKTEQYFDKYLSNDLHYERFYKDYKIWENENGMIEEKPRYEEAPRSIYHGYAIGFRNNLIDIINTDESFGYLFYFLASDNNRRDKTGKPIDCVPDKSRIIEAVNNYRDMYPSDNLMEYLEDDLNYDFYSEKHDITDLSDDDDWLIVFNEAYKLFDIIRTKINVPKNAMIYLEENVNPKLEFGAMIISLLIELVENYNYDMDDKTEKRFLVFEKKIREFYNEVYVNIDDTSIDDVANKSIDEMNLKELTNNFDCDTIEKVVKSYDGFIMQTEVLDVIQREYKKEKAKNLWNMDITDVNKFCDLLREELKSHKYQINKNNINKDKSIIIEKEKAIEEKDRKIKELENLLACNTIKENKNGQKIKMDYPTTRNGYTINSYINSNDLNSRTIFLAIITFFQEKEFDTLDFFTDLNQHFTNSLIPQEIYIKYPSTKEEGKIFIFCLLMMIDKKKSSFLILKNLKAYFDDELRIKFINEINIHRKDINLPAIEIPNLHKEGILQNAPNKSIEIEMFNAIKNEFEKNKSVLEVTRYELAKLHDINLSLMEKIKEYEENKRNDNNKESEKVKDVEPITKSMNTLQKFLVFYYLFNELGVNYGNSDKSQWIRFIHKMTGYNEQNIKEKFYTDFDTKETKKNLRLIAPLFTELFPKIEEKIKKDSQD